MNSNSVTLSAQGERARYMAREDAAIELRRVAVRTAMWHCCLNCLHFDSAAIRCAAHNAQPPVEVVVVGCRDWDDEIPF